MKNYAVTSVFYSYAAIQVVIQGTTRHLHRDESDGDGLASGEITLVIGGSICRVAFLNIQIYTKDIERKDQRSILQIIHSKQALHEQHYEYFLYQILRGLKVR